MNRLVSWNRSTVDGTPLVQGALITDQLAADRDPSDELATSGAVLHVAELVIGRAFARPVGSCGYRIAR